MDRTDEYAQYLFPDCSVIDYALSVLRKHFHIVQVGKGKPRYLLENIDTDLSNKTTVSDVLDLAKGCSGMVGQLGNMIPLAESFDKKCLAVWAAKGLKCQDQASAPSRRRK